VKSLQPSHVADFLSQLRKEDCERVIGIVTQGMGGTVAEIVVTEAHPKNVA
jgi:hypothetical protein